MSLTEMEAENSIIESWKTAKPDDCEKYKCPKCKNSTFFHTLFLKYGCGGCGFCEEIEVLAKRILEKIGYVFLNIELVCASYVITFKCSLGHITREKWIDVKRGYCCKTCSDNRIEKCKLESMCEITKCDCRSLNKGVYVGKGYICEHYNFAVMFPETFKRWCFDLNKDINPYKVAPGCNKKAYFTCKVYNEIYQQKLNDIRRGIGCPYCHGKAICVGNSLATTHPEIAKFWDPDNETKPTEVKSNSLTEVGWICEVNSEHKYQRSPYRQTENRQHVVCPMCSVSYAQKVGGFAHFVKVCSEIHNNKYQYPEQEFKGVTDFVNIFCPEITEETSEIHGIFRQRGNAHKKGQGCPKCAGVNDSIGVTTIKNILKSWGFIEKIHYKTEYNPPGLRHIYPLWCDFFFKEGTFGNKYPLIIEFDHSQHFTKSTIDWEYDVEINKRRDLLKDLYCVENKISIIRIPYMHNITNDYLLNLLHKCKDVQSYFSYAHYEREVRKKTNMDNILIEIVKLPERFDDLTCSF